VIRNALTISRDLVRDSVAALGEHHPDTLAAQTILARQLGAAGQPAEALSLARAVVDDATREVAPTITSHSTRSRLSGRRPAKPRSASMTP
jgi:hypothetical protein